MKKRSLAALLALLLCLSACQETALPAGNVQGAASVPVETEPPPEKEEPERYRLEPVEGETGLYQVASLEGERGYALSLAEEKASPAGEETVLYVMSPAGEDGCCQMVPAKEGAVLYEVTDAQEEAYYRLQMVVDEEDGEHVEAAPVRRPVLTQEDVDEALERAASDYSVTAISAAAIEGGKVTQSGAWGWAVKKEREMTPDTKLRVASLTKVALGMCAMAMEEDGILDLDAPLSDYWGEKAVNPFTQAQPSVRTLLSHSSSLKSLEITKGLSHLRSLLSSRSSWRGVEPGNGGYWHYNNFGYCVLGTTLELASDRLLEDYIQERFFQPLDIRASLYAGSLEAEELAALYNSWGGVEQTPEFQSQQKVPDRIGNGASYFAGGMTISAVDLAKLVSVLAGGGVYTGEEYQIRVLDAGTVEKMEEPQFTVDQADNYPFQQCLTLRRQEDLLGRPALYYHTGSAYGVFALLTFDPETGDGVVVLTTGAKRQTDERGLYALCAQVSAELYAKMEEER